MENLPPDPLLKPGAFIDPTDANGYGEGEPAKYTPASSDDPNPSGGGGGSGGTSTPVKNSDAVNAAPQSRVSEELPDWLPPGWRLEFRVRSSGASVGHRDKYYYDPVSNRRFRSKKEVLSFLETGSIRKRNSGSVADTPVSNKRKKADPKVSFKNFKFDNVPEKVKWVFTDVYEGSWSPFVGGEERVSESSKREWTAAFRYLSLQKNDNA